MIRLVLILTFTTALLCAADDLAPVYAKIDSASSSFKGLTAQIKRQTHTDVINEDDYESGKLTVKRNKPRDMRMRMDLTEPGPKEYVFSGTRVHIYYPKTNTDEEYDLGKYKNLVEQFLLLGFGSKSADLRGAYNIRYLSTETISGQPTWHIELIPKSPDTAQTFPKIELWISQATGIALEQKLYEKGGKDFQQFTYSDMKLRSDIPDSDVNANIPKDARHTKPPIK